MLIISPMQQFVTLIDQGVVLLFFDEASNLDSTILY